MSNIAIEKVTLKKIHDLGRGYFVFDLGPFSKTANFKPGQFIHIRIPDSNIMFRRAFSVYDTDPAESSFSIIFKVFGRGTRLMSQLCEANILDIMGPLGNSFVMPDENEIPILVAGGIGMPPIYLLAKWMVEKGIEPERIKYFYGGATSADLVELERIKRTGISFYPATEDGSSGFAGLVTDAIRKEFELGSGKFRLYACGPPGMLRAVDALGVETGVPGQVSLEAPMPCGVGICLGCILPLRNGGYTRVCREGPVYNIGEVLL